MIQFYKTTLSILLLSLSFSLTAKTVDLQRAEKVAKNLISERADNKNLQITSTDLFSNQDIILMYLFHLNNGRGFILVSADDRAYPVPGYSFDEGFKTEKMPENINSWINTYNTQISEAISMDLSADAPILEAWQHYSAESLSPADNTMSVSPLVLSKWDQGCFYNALCPQAVGGDCNRTWVGCVATAMGMVMRHHNYPAQGTGSHSYTHATYGVQSANFGSTTYNWASMPNQLWGSNTATATLLYHCGISVEMDYGVSGSGAQTADVRNALINYFNYSTSTYFAEKFWYSDAAWDALIRTDLENNMPIIYSGYDGNYGHCFVLDGYQGTNHFHFNWGWSGSNNGYFYLSNLNSGNGAFNSYQKAVFHISPPVSPIAQFSSAQTGCTGNPVNFTSQATGFPTSFSWSFPGGTPSTSTAANPSVKYSVSGTYDVKLKVSNQTGSDSITKTAWITVNTSPSKPLPSDTTICCYSTIMLDAANQGSTYSWNTGEITQTITADSTNTGIGVKSIIVNITSAQFCMTKDTINITFAACSGIEENAPATNKVWPNPSNGMVYLQCPDYSCDNTELTVYSADGRRLSELTGRKISGSAIEINLDPFPGGIYLIRIQNEKGTSVFKITLLK